jgi:hypothetical protein
LPSAPVLGCYQRISDKIEVVATDPQSAQLEAAVAIVGRVPPSKLVLSAGLEAIEELQYMEAKLTGPVRWAGGTSPSVSFQAINADRLVGLDRIGAKQLLRWVPAVHSGSDRPASGRRRRR